MTSMTSRVGRAQRATSRMMPKVTQKTFNTFPKTMTLSHSFARERAVQVTMMGGLMKTTTRSLMRPPTCTLTANGESGTRTLTKYRSTAPFGGNGRGAKRRSGISLDKAKRCTRGQAKVEQIRMVPTPNLFMNNK